MRAGDSKSNLTIIPGLPMMGRGLTIGLEVSAGFQRGSTEKKRPIQV